MGLSFTNRVCLMLCLSAQGIALGQVASTPPGGDSRMEKAYAQLISDMKLLWRGGRLTFEQKIDVGRLYEQLHSATMAARGVTPEMVEEKSELLISIVSEKQWALAREAAQKQADERFQNSLETFQMSWPQDQVLRWQQAFADAEADLRREFAEFHVLRERVGADVRNRSGVHFVSKAESEQDEMRSAFNKPALLELNIRLLGRAPYVGYGFDRRVLEDPALSPEQRREFRTRIVKRFLSRRLTRDPLISAFPHLQLSDEQLDSIESTLARTDDELRSAAESFVIFLPEDFAFAKWYSETFFRHLGIDDLLNPSQRKFVADVRRIQESRVQAPFAIGEIERGKLGEVMELVAEYESRIEGIPYRLWGRDMQYQEARLDLKLGLLRLAMNSDKLSARRKGEIAEARVKHQTWDMSRIFTSPSNGLLRSWPVILPGGLPDSDRSSETLSNEQWIQIYEVYSRPEILDGLTEGHLLKVSRMIKAQAGGGQVLELQVLADYKTKKALYRFMEALLKEPFLTPLQKLLLFEPYWNNIGPFSAYFFALEIDADILKEKTKSVRSLLTFSRSWPPETQLVYSVEDIATRARRSVESVDRWSRTSGAFTEEEMKALAARRDQLLERIDEWSQYVPPDPNRGIGAPEGVTAVPIQ